MPTVPQRQAVKLPDSGSKVSLDTDARRRKAMMAGIMTGAQGVLTPASTAKTTLG
jgi:hypothetical protein